MRVEIKISGEVAEPYIVIYASTVTEEVQRVIDAAEQQGNIVSALDEDGRIAVLQPADIYLVRTEEERLAVYCEKKKYSSKKRLYEFAALLGVGFMQISRSAFVNLKYIDSVEACFNSMMRLRLKNGCCEYISRKYLQDFKRYLGL